MKQRLLTLLLTISMLAMVAWTTFPVRAQETSEEDVPVSPCLRYRVPIAALTGKTTTIAFTMASYCSDCETEAWKRCDAAIAAGGNSCDCTRAYVDYCWSQCRICKHCSLQIFFYQDTGCPGKVATSEK